MTRLRGTGQRVCSGSYVEDSPCLLPAPSAPAQHQQSCVLLELRGSG
jgi:hypothetical protein